MAEEGLTRHQLLSPCLTATQFPSELSAVALGGGIDLHNLNWNFMITPKAATGRSKDGGMKRGRWSHLLRMHSESAISR